MMEAKREVQAEAEIAPEGLCPAQEEPKSSQDRWAL